MTPSHWLYLANIQAHKQGKSPTPGISPLALLGIAGILHEKRLGTAFAITHVDTLVQRLFLTEKKKDMVIGLHAYWRNWYYGSQSVQGSVLCRHHRVVDSPWNLHAPHLDTGAQNLAWGTGSKGNYWTNVWHVDLSTFNRDRSHHSPFQELIVWEGSLQGHSARDSEPMGHHGQLLVGTWVQRCPGLGVHGHQTPFKCQGAACNNVKMTI